MVQRLLLERNPLSFKISAPGVDVDAADYTDLLFDISLGKMASVWLSGSFARTAMTFITGNATTGTARFTINYGRTFEAAPQIIAFSTTTQFAGTHIMPFHMESRQNGLRYLTMSVRSYEDYGEVILQYTNVNWTPLPSTFYYCVLRM